MTLRNNRHNGRNNVGLVCAASALAVACLFSVTTASAASLPDDQMQGQETAQPVSDAATGAAAAAMPDNPGTPLPGAVSNAIPDDAVAVSNDLAVTPDGTLKDVATGATVTDQALVGTPQTAPDPLAKTDGKKFIPVPIGDVKEALKDQGADSASADNTDNMDSTDNSANPAASSNAARLTSAVAYTASTSATVSTATYQSSPSTTSATASANAQPRTRLASLPDNNYGAHWGQYNGSQDFFESGGTLFAQQAKGVVDVSEWQGNNIDWAKAKAAGVQGAIIRLSFGSYNRFDKYAKRNISECKRLGIPFGVYWYSYAENATDSGHEGADMAAKLQEVGVKPGDMQYPAFYDLEKWVWSGHNPPSDPSTYTGMVNAWSAALRAKGYTNLSVYSYANYLKTALNSSSIHARTHWVASYGPRPGFTYTTNDRGWQYTSSGKVNGFAGNVDLNAFGVLHSTDTVAVYRVYNKNSGLHHYTTKLGEKDALVKLGWRYEGVSFNAAKTGSAGDLKPVYREYNPHDGNHNWTLNKAEHTKLVSLGWHDEGIAWYTNPAGPVTVYRLYNPHSGEHVYTTSQKEYDAIGKAGWHKEGVAWKGLAAS